MDRIRGKIRYEFMGMILVIKSVVGEAMRSEAFYRNFGYCILSLYSLPGLLIV
jgi:hypothetical protein